MVPKNCFLLDLHLPTIVTGLSTLAQNSIKLVCVPSCIRCVRRCWCACVRAHTQTLVSNRCGRLSGHTHPSPAVPKRTHGRVAGGSNATVPKNKPGCLPGLSSEAHDEHEGPRVEFAAVPGTLHHGIKGHHAAGAGY